VSDVWLWCVALVGALAFLVLVLPHLGIRAMALGSRLGARLGSRRRMRLLGPLLPTAAPPVAHAVGCTPPLRVADLRRILLVTIPLMPIFIVWMTVVLALQARWHRRVEVLVTADGTAWVTRPVSNWLPRKGSTVIGSQQLDGWPTAVFEGGFVEGELAGLRIGLAPGQGTARLLSFATGRQPPT
jgi:hypothetical protein